VITFYRANGKGPERLGGTIDRIGFDVFMKAVK
jgi:dissimilatory sulfite reductase (desulfoviridin) alpha/beta subunit